MIREEEERSLVQFLLRLDVVGGEAREAAFLQLCLFEQFNNTEY